MKTDYTLNVSDCLVLLYVQQTWTIQIGISLTLFLKLVYFLFSKHKHFSILSCPLPFLYLLASVQNIYIHNIQDTINFPQKHTEKIKSHTSGIPSNLDSKVITISLSPGLNSSTPVFP